MAHRWRFPWKCGKLKKYRSILNGRIQVAILFGSIRQIAHFHCDRKAICFEIKNTLNRNEKVDHKRLLYLFSYFLMISSWGFSTRAVSLVLLSTWLMSIQVFESFQGIHRQTQSNRIPSRPYFFSICKSFVKKGNSYLFRFFLLLGDLTSELFANPLLRRVRSIPSRLVWKIIFLKERKAKTFYLLSETKSLAIFLWPILLEISSDFSHLLKLPLIHWKKIKSHAIYLTLTPWIKNRKLAMSIKCPRPAATHRVIKTDVEQYARVSLTSWREWDSALVKDAQTTNWQ
jgi:hypothetical protein